tara:strand:- start:245 stop:412 length:168 start_codon:yes stop_codon:yes gene_type:complete
MNKNQIAEQIDELYEVFTINHNSTSKAGAQRARKALSGIKNLISDYRKASINESK